MKDHYATLGLDAFVDFDTISKTYKKLILQHHPDKANIHKPNHSSEDDRFIRIQEAWQTLRDEETRKRYDDLLRQAQSSSTVAVSEEVTLEDMQVTEINGENEYSWPCRCGDKFIVSEEELEEEVDLVFCRSCSFAIKIV